MQPNPRSAGVTVQIRPAASRAELSEFTRWHRLAGVPQARRAGRNLVDVSDAGILSTGLTRSYAPSVLEGTSTAGSVPTVLAARTMALVAMADGRPIGGLSAGPSFFLCAQLAVLGPAVTLQAALSTIKIHALAVEPGYQRHRIGTALLRHAIATARDAGARIVYGQFDTSTPGLAAFYRHCGMNLAEPDAPLDLDALIELPAIIASLPGETLFHQVMNQ
ncbi:GNAT family N-acetyltransferase [Nocardia vinacea]|uniref:GNAT family N-acetyltransferase n=1 Tax=Nocardia vinacea TaxID=96468 RepID=UPI002E12AB4C|nr:GNAT family N-acetyltransferase [Nocardia vinacea]